MASDGSPVLIPAASLVQGSQAHIPVSPQRGGTSLPSAGKLTPIPAATTAKTPARAATLTSTEEVVAELNKHINVSGRADQYRVDPTDQHMIQQINPATGDVLGEFAVTEFPALARSLGIAGSAGAFVDEQA
jgi:hypothetical protein